jgi:hypothetical protein
MNFIISSFCIRLELNGWIKLSGALALGSRVIILFSTSGKETSAGA